MDNVIAFNPRPVTLPGDLIAVARQYLEQLQAAGRARETLRAYRTDLEQLAGYCRGRGITLVQHVSAAVLDDFVQALVQGEGVTARTAARKLAVVKGLCTWCIKRGMLQRNPVDETTPVHFVGRRVIAPEGEAIMRMINAIPTDTPLGRRDRAMLLLAYDAALRISALVSLDVHDGERPPKYTVSPGGVVRYRAKGGRAEDSVCGDDTLAALAEWLRVRERFVRRASPPALFLSERGTRLTRAAMHYRIKLHGKAAGMPQLHMHLLRHRRGGELIDSLGPRHAQALLGHKRMSTTVDVYGHQSAERLREQIRARCPVGGLN